MATLNRGGRTLTIGAGFAVAFAAALLAMPAAAQDASLGRGVWLGQANCADCHGWLGNGVPEDPRAPRGANLRNTTMDLATLSEVILCGIPGTGMPHFDPRAYTDTRCYGSTREQLGDATPFPADASLTKRLADGLAAFILAEFAGKGDPTQTDCTTLLGADNRRCALLPP